jgi:hypothetical protein
VNEGKPCKVSGKQFCKVECRLRFEQEFIFSCQLAHSDGSTCKHKFVKSQGVFVAGKWFCSEDCSGKDEDVQKFIEMEA